MKTTVEIPDALLSQAKSYASARGVTLKELIEAGLRTVLGSDRSRSKPFRLHKATFKGQGINLDAGWQAIRREIYKGRGE